MNLTHRIERPGRTLPICDAGMSFKVYSEPDTSETDIRIKALFPDAVLERGVQYARWLVFAGIRDQTFIDEMSKTLGALGHYSNFCLGKPFTVLFFCDWFASQP